MSGMQRGESRDVKTSEVNVISPFSLSLGPGRNSPGTYLHPVDLAAESAKRTLGVAKEGTEGMEDANRISHVICERITVRFALNALIFKHTHTHSLAGG